MHRRCDLRRSDAATHARRAESRRCAYAAPRGGAEPRLHAGQPCGAARLGRPRGSARGGLLHEAERSHAFTPDNLAAQRAWVDLEEAREAVRHGDMQRATTLHARALTTTHRLRAAWPEWEVPYRILTELQRIAPNDSGASLAVTEDQSALLRAARKRVVTGAFVR